MIAYEQIFPALLAMSRRGHLDVPVIGVAKPDWTVEQLHARARKSIAAHGDVDKEAFSRLAARLTYVAGDYHEISPRRRLSTPCSRNGCVSRNERSCVR